MALSSKPRLAHLAATAALLGIGSGCERPPVGGAPDVEEGSAVVDLPSFLQDRPAIGGKWYDYSVDGHVLQPKDQTWIARLRDGGHAAFRIDSIYDDNTGDSGVFHFSVAHHDGAAWGEAEAVTAGGNVKDGNVCVSLADGATVGCDGDGWDLRLVNQSRLSVFAGFAVAEPAVILHEDVVVARLDGASLSALPAPSTLQPLNDAPSFESTDWRFDHLAPHLPPAGRVFGDVARLEGHTWWLASSSFRLGRLSFSATSSSLAVSVKTASIDSSSQTVDADAFDADDGDSGGGGRLGVELAELPAYLALSDEGVTVVGADVVGATLPGNTRRWDLAIVRDPANADAVHVLLSPGAAAINGSALGKDPPLTFPDSP